jgi:hypothetical protein
LITCSSLLHGHQAVWSTYNMALQATPCHLVYAEVWLRILHLTQTKIESRERSKAWSPIKWKEHKTCILHKYKVGYQVLLKTPGILRKLSIPPTGPYLLMKVYKNGATQIQKAILSEM